jgi:hypothetical protein
MKECTQDKKKKNWTEGENICHTSMNLSIYYPVIHKH